MVYLSIDAGEWKIDSNNILINQQQNDVQSEKKNISDLEELDEHSLK